MAPPLAFERAVMNGETGLCDVARRIRAAEAAADRAPGSVKLVAVSKKQPPGRVQSALDRGHRRFGENRVQEAEDRWRPLRERHPDIELHLVGPLQTNKARLAMTLFDVIQSVDRPKLARRLADLAQELGRCPSLFVQVNTGEEAQKSGIPPVELDAFLKRCGEEFALQIKGLMAIPPADEEPALHFALLDKLAKRNGLTSLSMGMSADFETAISFGATHVRVGTAVFGYRT